MTPLFIIWNVMLFSLFFCFTEMLDEWILWSGIKSSRLWKHRKTMKVRLAIPCSTAFFQCRKEYLNFGNSCRNSKTVPDNLLQEWLSIGLSYSPKLPRVPTTWWGIVQGQAAPHVELDFSCLIKHGWFAWGQATMWSNRRKWRWWENLDSSHKPKCN